MRTAIKVYAVLLAVALSIPLTAQAPGFRLREHRDVAVAGDDGAEGVAILDNRAIIIGSRKIFGVPLSNWYVAARDLETGQALWEDEHIIGEANSIVVTEDQILVAGYVLENNDQAVFIRSYSPDGDVLWDWQTYSIGNNLYAQAIGVNNGMLYVASVLENTDPYATGWAVEAFHLDGELAWTTLEAFPYDTRVEDTLIAFNGDLLTVVGHQDQHWHVNTYNGSTGAIVWSDRGPFGKADDAVSVGDKIYVAGNTQVNRATYATLRAYNAADGTLAWEDTYGPSRGFNDYDQIGAGMGLVIAAGEVVNIDTGVTEGVLRAFDPDGDLAWEEHFDVTNGGDEYTNDIDALVVDGPSLVITGEPGHRNGDQRDWMVRVYETATGELRWDELISEDNVAYSLDDTFSAAISGNRLVVNGMTLGAGSQRTTIAYVLGLDSWAVGECYKINDPVYFNGVSYRCRIAHCAYSEDWNPELAPSLWVRDQPDSLSPWTPGTVYDAGARVTYNGGVYTCLMGHTSLVGWEPSAVPSIWALD